MIHHELADHVGKEEALQSRATRSQCTYGDLAEEEDVRMPHVDSRLFDSIRMNQSAHGMQGRPTGDPNTHTQKVTCPADQQSAIQPFCQAGRRALARSRGADQLHNERRQRDCGGPHGHHPGDDSDPATSHHRLSGWQWRQRAHSTNAVMTMKQMVTPSTS